VAGYSHFRLPAEEPGDFGRKSAKLSTIALIAGVAGIVLAFALGYKDYFRRFYFAYLTGYGFVLALVLGAQFFVLTQHVTRAGWSVNVRRVAENIGALAPLMAVLFLPIFFSVLIQKGDLYPWALPGDQVTAEVKAQGAQKPEPAATGGEQAGAKPAGNAEIAAPHDRVGFVRGGDWPHNEIEAEADPGHGKRKLDETDLKKRAYLSPLSWTGRAILYFIVWSAIGVYYRRHSVQQDVDGDVRHTVLMQKWSGVAIVGLGLTLTFAAFDWFMSLDPHWYSTMFGVYYFAGTAVSIFSALALIVFLMQRAGFLREAVTPEHYHDLGKYMFAFTFFWGYITFDQYMLLWYSSIPEEVTWMSRHGATTGHPAGLGLAVLALHRQWGAWAIIVLFGCFVVPFSGLLSRHPKRNPRVLVFFAVWILVFQFVNMIWIVTPELRVGFVFPLPEILALIGVGGIATFVWLRNTASARVRPVNDPRVFESAAFVNI
jgi:hypothetical protein